MHGDDIKIKNSIVKAHKQSFTINNGCAVPLCKSKAINSHTISESELRKVSEDNHIIHLSTNIYRNNPDWIIAKSGVSKFSTFLGFCKTHDEQLFKKIDTLKELNKDEQQEIFTLEMFRIITRELYLKKASINMGKKIELSNTDNFNHDHYEYLRLLSEISHDAAINDIQTIFNITYTNIKRKKYKNIEYKMYKFDNLPIAVSSSYTPNIDANGSTLQDFFNIEIRLDNLCFYSIHLKNHSYIVFSWLKKHKNSCLKLIKSLHFSNNSENIIDFCIQHSENVAINPTWWNNLSQNDKNKYCNMIGNLDGGF